MKKIVISNILSFLFIIFAVSLAYYGMLIGPVNLKFNDATSFFTYGNDVVKKNFLTYGQLGLWDTYNGLGYPLIGHLSSQFYPLMLPGYFMPNMLLAIRYISFLHLLLGGIACFYLLRVLRCHAVFSTIGSILYIVNYYVMTTASYGVNSEIYNLIWMPLAVAFFWQALFLKKNIYAIATGIALAMHVLSLSLYSIYFTEIILLCMAIFSLFYETFITKKNIISSFLTLFAKSIIVLTVTVGLSAIKLLPVFEFSRLSMRQHLPLYGAGNPFSNSQWELSTGKSIILYLTNLIVPWEHTFTKYTPINLLFFSLVLLSLLRKSREIVFLVIVSIIALWASMGKNAPFDIYAFFYKIIPGLDTIEHTNRFFIITNFTLPVLAAFGGEYVYKNLLTIKKMKTLVPVFLLCILVFPAMKFISGQMTNAFIKSNTRAYEFEKNNQDNFNKDLKQLTQSQAQVFHVTALYRYFNEGITQYTAYENNFKLTNPPHPDFTLNYQYFTLSPKILYNNTFKKSFDADFVRKKYTLLRLMNSKYYVIENKYTDYPNGYITPIKTRNDGVLYEVKNYLPYFFTVDHAFLLIGESEFRDFTAFKAKMLILYPDFDLSSASVFTSDKEFIDDYSLSQLSQFDAIILSDAKTKNYIYTKALLQDYIKRGGQVVNLSFSKTSYDDVRYRSLSILTNKPALFLNQRNSETFHKLLSSFPSISSKKNTIQIIKNTPEYIRISITTQQPKTFLQISDSYYPGWKAYDNNREIPVYMGDGLVKGIAIPGIGTHSVVFLFKPMSFYIGALISAVTVMCLLIYAYVELC